MEFTQNKVAVMNNKIELIGVSTNNLKSIDASFCKNKITSITGISGGGKSSLAYGSLYEKCRQEFMSIEVGYFDNSNYIIDSCKNIIPAVALKQKNYNINPRSTIYSYLNLSSVISSYINDENVSLRIDLLKINKPKNQCVSCNGLGVISTLDINKIIYNDIELIDNPFIPWRSSINNKKHKLLLEFCKSENINLNSLFKDLSKNEKLLLTSYSGCNTYSVNYKVSGKGRSRKIKYTGVVSELEGWLLSGSDSEKKQALKYCKSDICADCNGSRVNLSMYTDMFIGDLSFSELLVDPINNLLEKIKNKRDQFDRLYNLLNDIKNSGLGYLSLNRSIPTLSGGELQKLNFSRISSTEITGLLVVIDEISSQVHASDYSLLINGIKNIKEKGNTVVLVEHNQLFIEKSDSVIEIGPVAGKCGGYIVESPSHINLNSIVKKEVPSVNYFEVKRININNVKNVDISFPESSISVLVGKSGSGKSSIAKYINENILNTIYVSQELIKANVRSTVATLTGLNKKISKLFSEKYNIEDSFFNISESSSIVCDNCSGKGVIRISRSFESDIESICPTCNGELFNENSEEFSIKEYSIKDIYNLSLTELKKIRIKGINKIVEDAISLGLGHLSLNRKTQTLSGGELKRLKLLINLPIKNRARKILIIDEPGGGLDDFTSKKVMEFIQSFKSNYKSIIIVDHKPSIFICADYIIEVGPGSGDMGGKVIFTGSAYDYYKNKYLSYISDL